MLPSIRLDNEEQKRDVGWVWTAEAGKVWENKTKIKVTIQTICVAD